MIKTLETMSGTTHKSYIDQKTVTRDMEKMFRGFGANEGKASYMMTTKEVPVISYNDMAYIGERNSIVFRAGDSPIWNKNETILPMSWRLFQNTIQVPGKDYTLQTVPTTSGAVDFDLKKNMPNFSVILKERMDRALLVEECEQVYRDTFHYTEDDIAHMNSMDVYASDIMDMVEDNIRMQQERMHMKEEMKDEYYEDDPFDTSGFDYGAMEENTDVINEVETRSDLLKQKQAKIYAGNTISKEDLVRGCLATHSFDKEFVSVYMDIAGDMYRDTACSRDADGSLCSADGVVYIKKLSEKDAEELRKAANQSDTNVYSDEEITQDDIKQFASHTVTDDFYLFLASLPDWRNFAKGRFETKMAEIMLNDTDK